MPRLVGLTAVVILAALAATGARAATPSHPAVNDAEAAFTASVNGERTSRGLGPYAVAGDLVAVAREHADQMARQRRLHHNPRLRSQVRDWEAIGENVGRGASVELIHRAFMESPGHRRGVLNRRFSQVGVGVVRSGADIWVVEVFRRPPGPGASAPGHPRPATGVAPPVAPPEPPFSDVAPAEASPGAASAAAAGNGTGWGWGPHLGEEAGVGGPAGMNDTAPAPVRVAASLVVLVVAAQVAVARRLRLV